MTVPVGLPITEIANRRLTGLTPLMDLITRRRNNLFGHAARLGKDTPAHQACHRDRSTSLSDVFLIALGNVPRSP